MRSAELLNDVHEDLGQAGDDFVLVQLGTRQCKHARVITYVRTTATLRGRQAPQIL